MVNFLNLVGKNIIFADLVDIHNEVSREAAGGTEVWERAGEVDSRCVRDVQTVGVIFVPLLHCCQHLPLICTDNVHVLHREQLLGPHTFYLTTYL